MLAPPDPVTRETGWEGSGSLGVSPASKRKCFPLDFNRTSEKHLPDSPSCPLSGVHFQYTGPIVVGWVTRLQSMVLAAALSVNQSEPLTSRLSEWRN